MWVALALHWVQKTQLARRAVVESNTRIWVILFVLCIEAPKSQCKFHFFSFQRRGWDYVSHFNFRPFSSSSLSSFGRFLFDPIRRIFVIALGHTYNSQKVPFSLFIAAGSSSFTCVKGEQAYKSFDGLFPNENLILQCRDIIHFNHSRFFRRSMGSNTFRPSPPPPSSCFPNPFFSQM